MEVPVLIRCGWTLKGYAITDKGRRRSQNEDVYVCDPEKAIFLVADGMGGENYGEVASRLTADFFTRVVTHYLLDDEVTLPFEQTAKGDIFIGILAHAVDSANAAVIQFAEEQPSYKGMGSTLTAAICKDDRVYVAHVGDSRLYRFNLNTIEQITEDHTRVQEMVDKKLLTPEEARVHPQKNVITKCIGRKKRLKPDIFYLDVILNSIYLLCSDGLNDMIPNEEIQRILAETDTLDQAGKRLVDTANRNGGKDNITAVLFQAVAKVNE
jgi:serine/threonine protein phosphatase PrpC